MDIIDSKIINCLLNNSRMSSKDIASRVGLSPAAASERIKKLECGGVIKKYTTILNNEALGKELTAIITVRLDHPKYADEFIKAATNNSNVTECHYVAGDYDYLLKVVTRNPNTLEHVIQSIKATNGVTRTNTTIVLSTIKYEYSILDEKGDF